MQKEKQQEQIECPEEKDRHIKDEIPNRTYSMTHDTIRLTILM